MSTRAQAAYAKDAINEALDLFHRRWTLRVIWELRDAPLNFRSLQAACGELSPSVLNQRLAELREAGIVEHRADEGYALTDDGLALIEAFDPLTRWAVRWRRRRHG
ncbi:MAG: transcriptional regulator [Aquabacterium sp.]|jgi:DNA-binding HxlR family transcriptional regulator|nr:MAG: transcriptional regulator [Aquabacterium sp.]TAL27034.1 MAG: transcriptional regulator [Aquabacterium sp.]